MKQNAPHMNSLAMINGLVAYVQLEHEIVKWTISIANSSAFICNTVHKQYSVASNRRACLCGDEKAISPNPSEIQIANGTGICWGGMASSNVKIGAKPPDGVVAVLQSLNFALP